MNPGEIAALAADVEEAASSKDFEALFRACYPAIVQSAMRVLGNQGEAEEAAAEAFVRLFRLRKPVENPVGWLRRCVLHLALDQLRATHRRDKREHHDASVQEPPDNPESAATTEQRRRQVRSILAEMPDREAALLLARADGGSYRDLAECAGVNPSSVGTLLARAQKQFQERYENVMESNNFASDQIALLDEPVELTPAQIDIAWVAVQSETQQAERNRLLWPMAIAASLLVTVLMVPSTRALAQSAWNTLTVGRTQHVKLDFSKTSVNLLLPNVMPLYPPSEVTRWKPRSGEEANALAGFPVRKISSPLLPYSPAYRIEQPPVLERVIDMAAIREDLHRLGRGWPSIVPAKIDGARIVVRPQGRSAITSYGECPQLAGPWRSCAFLVQTRPALLELPTGLAWEPFTRFSLELAGLTSSQSRELANRSRLPPLFFPLDDGAELTTVTVRGDQAMLMTYPQQNQEIAFVLEWREDGFQLTLFGRDPKNAIALAEALR